MNSYGTGEGPAVRGPAVAWAVVDSVIGPLMLAATATGLVSVSFHARPAVRDTVLDRLRTRFGTEPVEAPGSPRLAEPVRQLAAYFAGGLHAFDLALDWSLTGGFPREVLRELARGVPYGTVVGYGELAARVGRPEGAQAVGAAMGANPLPVVVPCHRVVESDGGLGGFGGGLETKRQLLALEGVLPQPLF
ncbi:methylated-DNA--[protein]-cysteine S-methyltransferase [Streptomyces sp. V2I9]|uniref:methylated-DNA--[protein]-cysteine S-methyltransferase n=1 Tax=Streptomyces sp. V2I9 TaxID=3042304 RepID=UPI002783A531|nr:methylated-DNA--[protein]-cysteine S-methyltransferase [Streptomyces sp. V2I9]MDQ0983852.1 methylated-DNA-[protein]-cysteine S-methyltransferase [Streptomyces sp. V2I9]